MCFVTTTSNTQQYIALMSYSYYTAFWFHCIWLKNRTESRRLSIQLATMSTWLELQIAFENKLTDVN